MEHFTSIKINTLAILGAIGGVIAGQLGGWDKGLKVLFTFMVVDYALGIILAGIFHKSPKTETGKLKSIVGWKGICKKGITLLIVLVGAQVDNMMGSSYVRDGLIVAFSINELTSVVETADLMGVWIPPILLNAIELLKKKEVKGVKE